MRACDIRDAGCQRAVAEAVACLRGGSAPTPQVELITEEEFLMRGNHEPSAEDAIAQDAWTRGLSLFGLSAPEVDNDELRMQLAQNVGAAYLADERRVVVIDRGEAMDGEEAVELLAHEMVHAMQDAEYDLEALFERAPPTFDGRLALRALIEGEATHYETLAGVQLRGWRVDDLRWQPFYSDWQIKTLKQAEADAQPLDRAAQRLSYAFGGAFATAVWLARGSEGLRAMFATPPRTTREILFGPASADLDVERETLDARAAPVLPSSFEPVTYAHLGAWIARLFSARMGVSIESRWSGARGLGADVLSVYRNPETGHVFASWRVRALPDAPHSWPTPLAPIVGWTESEGRDVYLVAQPPEATVTPRELAWQELPDDMSPDPMQAAMEEAADSPAERAAVQLHCVGRPGSRSLLHSSATGVP